MAEQIEMSGEVRVPVSQKAPQPQWGRRILTLLIAVAALGGFGVVVVYSYDKGKKVETINNAPVITARKAPTKVRPKTPGGMTVPNQDKQIFSQLDRSNKPDKVERLLPPLEPIATKPPPMPAEPGRISSGAPLATDEIGKRLAAIEPAAGNDTIPSPPPDTAVSSARRLATPSQNASTVKTPAAKPKVSPRLALAVDAPPKAAKSSSSPAFRIQIASLRSEDAAKKAWGRLTKSHADLFGKLKPNIVRIDLAKKGTFYRLQAGPLTDAKAARTLCTRAKKRKIGCLVVRP